ncbi:MAG: hypothetical protein AAF206_03860 [Bacteroidota bacterium]
MRQNRLFVIVLMVLGMSLSSCLQPKCPESTSLGELELTEETRDLFPYDGTESLVFVNERDVEARFTTEAGIIPFENQLGVNVTCDEDAVDRTVEFYRSGILNLRFDDEDNRFRLALSLGVLNDRPLTGDTILFDALQVSYEEFGIQLGSLDLFANTRGNEDQISDRTKEQYTRFNFYETVEIHDRVYANVHALEFNGVDVLFFNYTSGIVGFFAPTISQIWALDRIEK